MLAWIKRKIAAVRAHHQAQDYQDGYDRAAGALLRGGSIHLGDCGPTGHTRRGAIDALVAYRNLRAGVQP